MKKQEQMAREFYSVREVSEILGLHYNTVWRLANTGKIPASKIGRYYFIPASFIEGLKEQKKEEGEE
jgi:excisionase family DNA binding protein